MLTLLLRRVLAAMRRYAKDLRRRLASDAGYSTETVVITAVLVVIAISVVGTIGYKATNRAEGIDLEAEYEGP